MNYSKLSPGIIEALIKVLGKEYVHTDDEFLNTYGRDETENLLYKPAVVVRPRTAQEISAIIKIANIENIPVTPRGAGTGLSGGALAIYGGICLSMERFNKILEIDERNLQATVEPGVINEEFQNAVKEMGLFYPPDPASKGSCFLEGISHIALGDRRQ